MNLDAGVIMFEDSVATVKRTIESIRKHVRYIFVIDGKFQMRNDERLLSTPEVRDYVASVPNVIKVDFPNHSEAETRQQYIELAKKYRSDCLLWIDTDEWITEESDWNYLKNALEIKIKDEESSIYCILYKPEGKTTLRPSIWVHPNLINFTEAHCVWRLSDGTIQKFSAEYPVIPNFVMATDDSLRTKDYIKKTYDYQVKLIEYEKPFRDKYRRIMKYQQQHKYDIPGIPLS